MRPTTDRRGLYWLVFATTTMIWGSTFLAIRVGTQAGYPPVVGAATRLGLSGALLAIIGVALGRRFPTSRAALGVATIYGLFMFAGNLGFLYWSETWIPSATAAVLWASYPIVIALGAASFLRGEEPLSWRSLAGGVLGLAGIATVFYAQFTMAVPWQGMVAVGASILSASAATIALKRWAQEIDPITLNAVGGLVAAIALVPVIRLRGEPIGLPPTPGAWGALAYLTVAGSMAAFTLWSWLLKHWRATHLSFSTLISPLIAVLLGAAVLHEAISRTFAAGTALVLSGTALAIAERKS